MLLLLLNTSTNYIVCISLLQSQNTAATAPTSSARLAPVLTPEFADTAVVDDEVVDEVDEAPTPAFVVEGDVRLDVDCREIVPDAILVPFPAEYGAPGLDTDAAPPGTEDAVVPAVTGQIVV